MNWLKNELPITKRNLLVSFFLVSCAIGVVFDLLVDTRFDGFIHDEAIISKPRAAWKYSAIIALDPKVPEYISRKQALPLFGLAAENALNAGAAKVFLDAVIFEPSPNMRYAVCIDSNANRVVWNNDKESFNPLDAISAKNIERFSMPHPSPNVELFTLFNLDAALQINEDDLFNDTNLYRRSTDTSTRLLNLNRDSAVVSLAGASPIVADLFETRIAPQNDDVMCGVNEERMCRRIRFTDHELVYSAYDKYPIIPLSELIDCSNKIKPEIKKILQDRVIVIQVASLNETIDLHLTPISTSLSGSGELTAGPQVIVDSIETLAAFDHPRRPILPVRILLLILVAISCVWATAYLKTRWAIVLTLLWVAFTGLLCFLFPQTQLWPVMAVALTGISSLLSCFAAHLFFGTKRGMMIAKYLPAPVRSMLLSTGKDNIFVNKKTKAVVLISDVEGYTTVTSLLKDPALVFALINAYLEETTIILQEKYYGWLENYVGDLVCFYWPADNDEELEKQQLLALQAAIVQSELQQTFFKSLVELNKLPVEASVLKKISRFINAGIGVSTGDIVMGNLGPENGVQKFSVLGDPLNLSSRIEGLTRFFNTEIMITDELVASAEKLGFKVRKIARIRVKGRTDASEIYALGKGDDPRFTEQINSQWEQFCFALMEKGDTSAPIPEILAKDAQTLLDWYENDLFDKEQKTWNLTAK